MTEKELLRKTIKNILLREHRDRPGALPGISFGKPAYVFRPEPITSPESCATLFAYLPFGTEADPGEAIQASLDRYVPVAAPRVTGDHLQFHRITSLSEPFEQNRWGIPEPPAQAPCYFSTDPAARISEPRFPILVLVPALAFDRQGGRLGRGGGYYDRFLAALLARYADRKNEITVAGVGFSRQIVEHVPAEHHDISIDCLYTDV